MRAALLLACFGVVGCGSSPTSPSPTPTPSPSPTSQTVSITITETLSGGTLGTMTAEVPRLPAIVPVSFAGHLTRQAVIRSTSQAVDLIYEGAPFDLGFYRQLARNGYEGSGTDALRILAQSPRIYLQTDGLKAATVSAYEQAARMIIPALSGERLTLAGWETGQGDRPLSTGRIVVSLVNDESVACGRALVGVSAGHVWMNTAQRCWRNGDIVPSSNAFAHELGHALGFWHVSAPDALMQPITITGTPSPLERYHAAIAYSRLPGNQDIDSDSLLPASFQTRIIVD